MPSYGASIEVAAPPAVVFARVADLARHGEWSADPLEVRLVDGDGRVGSRYQATAQAQGKAITAELTVTEVEAPERFGFSVSDLTGDYQHRFTFTAVGAGTRVERQITTSRLSLPQLLLFYVVFFPVKLPNTKKAMERLKTKLEEGAARTATARS